MATRITKIQLVADIGDFIKKMRGASDAAKGIGDGIDTSGKAAETRLTRLSRFAESNEQHLSAVGGAFTAIGAAAAVGVGAAVKAYADFDKEMSEVRAAVETTGTQFEDLGALAIKAGADTAFSATEAAQGITELGKAGVSADNILNGGLNGALALAAAGSIDVGTAAEYAATAMTVFNLEGTEVAHVADLYAAAANNAQGEVGDFALAMDYAGPIAKSMGMSIEETTGALTLFATAGLTGERAGTGLRGMLTSISNPSAKAAEAMDELGISFVDANGEMLGMQGIATELQENLRDLTEAERNQALAVIFGTESLGAALALYNETTGSVTEHTAAIDKDGYAAEVAATKMNNLSGDIEALKGSLETALIGTGEGADGPLRALVQGLDDVVDGYNRLPDGARQAALTVGATTAAAGLAAGAFLTLGPRVLDVVTGMAELKKAAPGAAAGLGNVGRAAAVLTALMVAAPAVQHFTELTTDELLKLDDAIGLVADGKVEDFDRQISALQTNDIPGWLDAVNGSGGFGTVAEGLENLANPSLGNRLNDVLGTIGSFGGTAGRAERDLLVQQFSAMDEGLAALASSGNADLAKAQFEELTSGVDRTKVSQDDLNAAFPAYTEALGQVAANTELAAVSSDELAGAVDGLDESVGAARAGQELFFSGWAGWAGSTERSQEELDAMRDSITELGDAMGSFVDPLGTYTGLLEDKRAAEQAAADAAAVAAGDTSSAYQVMVEDVDVSLDEYLTRLEDQVREQDTWRANLVTLTSRMSSESLQILAAMGPEGARLVQQLVNGTDTEIQRFEEVMEAGSEAGTDAFAEQVIFGQPIIAEIAREFGAGAAREAAASWAAGTTTYGEIATDYGLSIDGKAGVLEEIGAQFGAGARDQAVAKFNAGTATMQEIADEYGIKVAAGLNPILKGLGQGPIALTYKGGTAREFFSKNADGNLYEDHQAEIAPGGAWRVWAEPETQGEAYIPLAPSKRSRSVAIWRETGRRLGMGTAGREGNEDPTFFADGGFTTAKDVPGLPAIPGAYPISTPAEKSVERMRSEALKRVKAYEEAQAAALATGGGPFVSPPGAGTSVAALIAYGRALRAQGLRVSSNAALGSPPSPGAHSSTGYHYKFGNSGAIDVNSHAGESAAEKRRLTPVALDALRKGFGVQWLSSGHYNHLHVDVGKYRAVGNTAAWMADGGMLGARDGAERHDAQTVTGLRTFGEPETGGEAYIPLAAHKRGRSLMVLQSVASQFGYTLSKMGGATFATPAATAAMTAGAGSSRTAIEVTQNITAPEPVAAGRISAARLEDTMTVYGLGGML